MRRLKAGELEVTIAGGTDREGGGDGPLIVLLHGFGAPGDDLVPLFRVFDVPSEVRWAFPSAPLSLGPMGYGVEARAWWMIDLVAFERAVATGAERDLSAEVPDGLAEARELVRGTLEALEAELKPNRLILGGFSQGAMLALDVALHDPRPLAGLVLLSGTLLAEPVWGPKLPSRAGLPVLQSHGTHDPILPYAMAEALAGRLKSAGLDHELIPFRGAHEIPPPVIEGMQRFLARHTS